MAKLTAHEEAADPTTPSTGDWILYFKSGGLYIIDDAGTVTGPLSAGGAGDMILASIQTVTGAKTFNSSKLILAGATSGTSTLNAAAVAGATTLTLPGSTDTLVGRDTSDTLTNKVLTSATITTKLNPTTNDGAPLGDTTHQFSDLFLAEGGVINWDNGDATLTQTNNVVTLAGATLETSTVGTTTNSVVTVDGTQTLTNKWVQPRVGTTTSSATPTINTDNYDAYSITAQAAAITSFTTNLSGTPVNFQKLIIRIKDDGTARAITWGASFEARGVALPTTTVISKVLTVGFIYDTVTSKWGCVASSQEV